MNDAMNIYTVHLIDPTETFSVRAESVGDAESLVAKELIRLKQLGQEASEITGVGEDTPRRLSYRITKCELDFANRYPKSGKKEILSPRP